MEDFEIEYKEEIKKIGLDNAISNYIFEYIKDKFYTQNLSNGRRISLEATQNLFNNLSIDFNTENTSDAERLFAIENYSDIGIVEDVANNNFVVLNNTIVREDEFYEEYLVSIKNLLELNNEKYLKIFNYIKEQEDIENLDELMEVLPNYFNIYEYNLSPAIGLEEILKEIKSV